MKEEITITVKQDYQHSTLEGHCVQPYLLTFKQHPNCPEIAPLSLE